MRVQNDYAEILKSEQVIEPLLVFLFDVLGHSAGRPLDLDRVGFTKATWEYDIWDPVVDTEPERDMQWLLVNIWFMCLKYTPDLAKTWFLALKSKQTTLAVSTWTEKYFSPYLVTEAKDIASKWAEEQEASGDEKKLIVRVSKNSPNINVGYEIDELMMSIVMSLPSSYPLDRVEVKGVNRVAVKESTWNGWMRTIQGATMFNVSPRPSSHHPHNSPLTNTSTERHSSRRSHGLQKEHRRGLEGPNRVLHLLLHHLLRQTNARQAMPDVQEPLSRQLLVQVVCEQ